MTTSYEDKVVVLITGGNRGIGYETALNLLQRPPADKSYHIILTSRSPSAGSLAASTLSSHPSVKGTISSLPLDVTSPTSVDAAASTVLSSYGKLDILVNNAGIFPKSVVKRDAMREVMETNVIGAVSVTEAFLPLLRKGTGKRIVFIGSSGGSLSQAADPSSKYHNPGAIEYRASKAAVNMLVVQYWVGLKGEGFSVLGADPGLCATDFVNKEAVIARGAVGADVGGERVAMVVRGERDGEMGRMHGEYGVSPW